MQKVASDASTEIDRRYALKILGAALGTVALAGCAKEPEGPPQTRLPLADLPLGERVRVDHHGDPVELRRTTEGVEARSLLCTHTGCTVQWKPEENHYRCPCHDAIFDARGEVVEGPPPRPLRAVPVRVEGGEVVVGEVVVG